MKHLIIECELRKRKFERAFKKINIMCSSTGKLQKAYAYDAMLLCNEIGLIHHAKMCKQISLGKNEYPSIINPFL